MKQKLYILLGSLVMSIVPVAANAELLPGCAASGNCTGCDFIVLAGNWAELMLSFVSTVVIITVIIGGLFWILSAGNPERVKRGQQILVGSVIGAGIVLGGFIIVNYTISSLTGSSDFSKPAQLYGTDWSTFCETGDRPTANVKTSCAADQAVDGDVCRVGACDDDQACTCLLQQCLSQCEISGKLDGAEWSCVSDDEACNVGQAGIITTGACPASKPVCCKPK